MGRWVMQVLMGLGALVAVLALVVGILAGRIYWRYQSSLPLYEGVVRVEGVPNAARIVRDRHGVAHIFGETDDDIYFALGYAHAQDRMFQMDLLRRLVVGRVSELVGERGLRSDIRRRFQGYAQVAQVSVDSMSPETLSAMERYAAGVNAFIADPRGRLSPEYAVLMTRPEPWTLLDSMAVGALMVDDLIAGRGEEVTAARLAGVLDPDRIAAFLTSYPDWAPTILSLDELRAAGLALPDETPALGTGAGTEEGPVPGSNSWVIDGSRTTTGLPMLANDPHLGLTAPGIWYLARLDFPERPVIGVTIPGLPFASLGRNDRIAWGFTNAAFDVVDYLPTDLEGVETTEREEIIRVRFGGDVRIVVTETPNGPVLDPEYFNLAGFGDLPLVYRSSANHAANGIANSALALMRAGDWDEFVEAGRDWTAPMQNMIYADVDGNIGYVVPGVLPIRDDAGQWIAEIAFEELPRAFNPDDGMIITANNRVVPDGYLHNVGGGWAPYRAARIENVLDSAPRHDLDSLQALQLDVTSVFAERVLGALLTASPETEAGRAALALFTGWNSEMSADAPQPLIFQYWISALQDAVFADELGDVYWMFRNARHEFMDAVLVGDQGAWCNNITSDIVETCADLTGPALDRAVRRLTDEYGGDPASWRWGDAHYANFISPLFSELPIFSGFYGVQVPMDGDGTTVNVAHVPFDGSPMATGHAAGYRALYDLSDLNNSRYVITPGQSGHPLSPHYGDMAELWAAGEYIEIRDDWTALNPPEGARILELAPRIED